MHPGTPQTASQQVPVAGDGLVALVLAAGRGTRLAPLTNELPKPLCPVGNEPLVDLAIRRCADPAVGAADIVVNTHHRAALVHRHLSGRWPHSDTGDTIPGEVTRIGSVPTAGPAGMLPLWVSWEAAGPRGTAGAIAQLATWLDGRNVVVVNADAFTDVPLAALIETWDGTTPAVLVAGTVFGPGAQVAGALVPWRSVQQFTTGISGLYETLWAPHHHHGTLEVVSYDGRFIDCGTPAAYLAANMAATGGESAIGAAAVVNGDVTRCVVWPGAHVESGERLADAIRTTAGRTVLVRP